jgi:hypothetical protein
VTAVLVLLLAACSTAGGDPTTTAPLAEPSTTTTTAPTTTTTTEPTTTTVEECTERDGLVRNSRGFICPPWLWAEGFPEFGDPTHLLGEYETRFFDPALSFAREERFLSLGENPGSSVALDGATFTPWVYAIATDRLDEVRSVNYAELEWIADLRTTEIEAYGAPATQIDFQIAEECESFTGECRIPVFDDLHISIESWTSGDRVRLLLVDRSNGPIGFEITASDGEFDTYWTEVAQPILDSIEFLDP